MIHLTATGLLWVNMKSSTHQLRRMIEKFFFIRCYCQMSISFRCFFYIFSSVLGSLSLTLDLFRPSLCGIFWTCPRTKKHETNELCVESLTKRETFLIIHQPAVEIPAKNTIGPPIKTVIFTSCRKEKPSFLLQYLLFSIFSFFLVKITLKPLLWAKNQNLYKIFHLKVSGNL